MKKVFLSLSLLFVMGAVFGQEVKYGLKAGVNFANQTFSSSGMSVSLSSLTSFHFHGFVDYGVSPNFSIQPGIGVSGKGFKSDSGEEEAEVNVMYLDIPVNALAKFPVSFGKIFLGGGPYAGVKLSEKYKLDGESLDEDESSFNTADFGVNFLGGLEFSNGLTLNANYGLGLINVMKESELADVTAKNKVFSISVGFLF
ncbi:outer membrane protein with beta-barrel domain [Arcticibacter tournemirensis]|uniref:PorT family protein n=1 Tax=Arcticibacter tournemirensis TaxID=699437 RepID=A0A5M9HEB8_9SPHI|nr:porin family protein [Arcticibacter tournemirensis]KAA8484675.1 PorT family protein [Arcticibacter tournemirensis]TQM47033.1 outer membrane protein with beta-barrel domain [Arcticibacter tournemirensis]